MTRLSAERRQEIVDLAGNWMHPDNGTRMYALEIIPELLAEIDALRSENEQT